MRRVVPHGRYSHREAFFGFEDPECACNTGDGISAGPLGFQYGIDLVTGCCDRDLGGYSSEVPPLPIPNREVKLTHADGTAVIPWESR